MNIEQAKDNYEMFRKEANELGVDFPSHLRNKVYDKVQHDRFTKEYVGGLFVISGKLVKDELFAFNLKLVKLDINFKCEDELDDMLVSTSLSAAMSQYVKDFTEYFNVKIHYAFTKLVYNDVDIDRIISRPDLIAMSPVKVSIRDCKTKAAKMVVNEIFNSHPLSSTLDLDLIEKEVLSAFGDFNYAEDLPESKFKLVVSSVNDEFIPNFNLNALEVLYHKDFYQDLIMYKINDAYAKYNTIMNDDSQVRDMCRHIVSNLENYMKRSISK